MKIFSQTESNLFKSLLEAYNLRKRSNVIISFQVVKGFKILYRYFKVLMTKIYRDANFYISTHRFTCIEVYNKRNLNENFDFILNHLDLNPNAEKQ